jgi:outer membrane protein insertion porin family
LDFFITSLCKIFATSDIPRREFKVYTNTRIFCNWNTVTNTPPGTFSVGLSNSNSAGSSFNVGIEEKNFLGTGNTLNAKTAQSKAVKELQVYFSNPYFTKDKHSISYGIFAKKTEGAELEVEEYKVNEKGGSVGYGIPITKDTRIGVNLKFSSRDITCGKLKSATGRATLILR